MCVCVYVCMYACMHGCMDAWMHGCMYAWMHGFMDAYMHGCMDAWMQVCMYVSNVVVMLMVMHPYIHTSIHPSLHPYIHSGGYMPGKLHFLLIWGSGFGASSPLTGSQKNLTVLGLALGQGWWQRSLQGSAP